MDKKDGKIVPLENAGCAEGIAEFIKDTDLRENIIRNLSQSSYSNEDQAKTLYTLID